MSHFDHIILSHIHPSHPYHPPPPPLILHTPHFLSPLLTNKQKQTTNKQTNEKQKQQPNNVHDHPSFHKTPIPIALRFHPDKSSSSHAEEAMKVISAAYKTLTDDGERRKYDASLHRPTGMSARQQFQQQYQFRGRPNQAGGAFGRRQYDDDELTAEDLFNMFFFNAGGPKVTPATRPQRPPQQQHHHTQREQHTQWNGAMHFIPLLIMLMLTLFTLFSFGTDSTTQTPSIISTPSYSFEQRQRYQIRQITPYLEVPFYVSRDYYWYVKHQPERIDNTKLYEEIEGNILTKQDAACNKALREHAADATGQCEKSQKLREKYLTAKQVLGKVKNNDANVHAEIIKKHTKGGK